MGTSLLEVTIELLKGFWINFKLFGITLVAALPIGLVLSFGSMSKFKPLKFLVKILVWIIRGTPLMLQIIVVFTARACFSAFRLTAHIDLKRRL